MNKEIKEILDRAKKLKYKCSCCEQIGEGVYISKYHEIETQNLIEAVYIIDKLLDYITNLEQRYDNLKQEHIDTITRNEDYRTRLDKTIETLKDTNVDMPSTLLIETIDYAIHQLTGGDE